jgi:hypothetical protein
VARIRRWETFPFIRAFVMQTDPTIDSIADPANQPLDEPNEQPRPLPDTPPESDPLAPVSSPEDEEALRRSWRDPQA